ncbi:Hypp3244 [Branchiostoma lanceolatum]|uniref:Hypp3244 protein n=1 Tax=Branchiostoma lanceolatum TaxID=7740 RepID=A0A8K0A0M8_BRALA|nr:Hypp3244 [Branchiostoma lanceolatum]
MPTGSLARERRYDTRHLWYGGCRPSSDVVTIVSMATDGIGGGDPRWRHDFVQPIRVNYTKAKANPQEPALL